MYVKEVLKLTPCFMISVQIQSSVSWSSVQMHSSVCWSSMQMHSRVCWSSAQMRSSVCWSSAQMRSRVCWSSAQMHSSVWWSSLDQGNIVLRTKLLADSWAEYVVGCLYQDGRQTWGARRRRTRKGRPKPLSDLLEACGYCRWVCRGVGHWLYDVYDWGLAGWVEPNLTRWLGVKTK